MRIADYIQREDISGDMATLADELGMDAVRAIYQSWRGCAINVPSRPPKRTIKRYVVAAMLAGRTVRDVARELGVSERYVQHLTHGIPDPRQIELFPEGETL